MSVVLNATTSFRDGDLLGRILMRNLLPSFVPQRIEGAAPRGSPFYKYHVNDLKHQVLDLKVPKQCFPDARLVDATGSSNSARQIKMFYKEELFFRT